MSGFFSEYIGTSTSQRLFLLLLLVQSALDVALSAIYMGQVAPEHRPLKMRSMYVANVVLGICFLGIFCKTNSRKSPVQLWGLVSVLIAYAMWDPVANVLAVLYTVDPHTKEPYSGVARILTSAKLAYRFVFVLMYIVLAFYVHRVYNNFNQVVKSYLGKPPSTISYAWNIRFRFVSLMGVHAIQVIVCVVAMFYMILPHVDIGHASIFLVVGIKAVVMVAALLGMLAATLESRWLMYGCVISLLGELAFFVVVTINNFKNNFALITSKNPAELVMIWGALSSTGFSVLTIIVSLFYAKLAMGTFGFGLKEWVKKEYNLAVGQASTNPFKE